MIHKSFQKKNVIYPILRSASSIKITTYRNEGRSFFAFGLNETNKTFSVSQEPTAGHRRITLFLMSETTWFLSCSPSRFSFHKNITSLGRRRGTCTKRGRFIRNFHCPTKESKSLPDRTDLYQNSYRLHFLLLNNDVMLTDRDLNVPNSSVWHSDSSFLGSFLTKTLKLVDLKEIVHIRLTSHQGSLGSSVTLTGHGILHEEKKPYNKRQTRNI